MGMNSNQANNMVGEIRSRWEGWSPGDGMIDDLVEQLKRWDWDITLAAVKAMRFETDRHSPPIKTLFEKIKEFHRNRPREKSEQEQHLSEAAPVYALCRKEHMGKRGANYFYKYFYQSHRRDILKRDPGRMAQQAEHRRQEAEQIYGGEWVVIKFWDDNEAQEPELAGTPDSGDARFDIPF